MQIVEMKIYNLSLSDIQQFCKGGSDARQQCPDTNMDCPSAQHILNTLHTFINIANMSAIRVRLSRCILATYQNFTRIDERLLFGDGLMVQKDNAKMTEHIPPVLCVHLNTTFVAETINPKFSPEL